MEKGDDPYYPVNDQRNEELLNQYRELAKNEKKVTFGGRLGEYRYYDMDIIIEKALQLAKDLI